MTALDKPIKVENGSGLPSHLACRFALANWTGKNVCAHCGEPPRGSDYCFPTEIIAALEPNLLRDIMVLRVLACADCISITKPLRHGTLGERRRDVSVELTKRMPRTGSLARRLATLLLPSPSGIPDNYSLIWRRTGPDAWTPLAPNDLGK